MRNVFFVNWFNTKLQQWALWVLDATSSCTDSLLVSHQPSFLSLSLSLLLSVLKSTNWATPALLPTSLSSSSLLHVYTLTGPNKPTGPTRNTHTAQFSLPTSHDFSFSNTLHPELCCQNTAELLFCYNQNTFLSSCLSQPASSHLLSSCQVDISFISQEVFDRSFNEEMYPPAASATAQQQLNNQIRTKIVISINHLGISEAFSLSLPASGPFHFTKRFSKIQILSSNVWSSAGKRDHLYILYLLD